MTGVHYFGSTALLLGLALASACGSSGGATRPADCPAAVACPVCPAAPRPGPKPTAIGEADIPHDRSRHYTLESIAADGKSALVRVEDELAGGFYQQLDLTNGPTVKAIKSWPFQPGSAEVATRKQALKAMKPEAPWPPSQRSSTGVVALAADDGDVIGIYLMKGERAVEVATLTRLKDEAGALADVAVTKLAWDPTGTRLVIVHTQKLAAAPGFTSDWVHVLTIDASRLPFD